MTQYTIKNFKFGDSNKNKAPKKVNLAELYSSHKLNELFVFLEGTEYIIDIEHYLRVGNLNEHSDVDLEKRLEEISSLRFTLTSSEEDLDEQIEELTEIMEKDRSAEVKTIMQGFQKITDKQLYSQFINSPAGGIYLSRKSIVRKYKNMKFRINGLQFILAERVKILTGMLERRYYVKKGRGKDGSI